MSYHFHFAHLSLNRILIYLLHEIHHHHTYSVSSPQDENIYIELFNQLKTIIYIGVQKINVGTNVRGKIIKTYVGGFNLGTLRLKYNLCISCNDNL